MKLPSPKRMVEDNEFAVQFNRLCAIADRVNPINGDGVVQRPDSTTIDVQQAIGSGGGGDDDNDGVVNNQPTVGITSGDDESVDEVTWDQTTPDAGEYGVDVLAVSRVVYNSSSNKVLYMMLRTLTFDSSGALANVGAEVRYTVDETEDCVDGETLKGGEM